MNNLMDCFMCYKASVISKLWTFYKNIFFSSAKNREKPPIIEIRIYKMNNTQLKFKIILIILKLLKNIFSSLK